MRKSGMRSENYELIADIINGLPLRIRKDVADHFAHEFSVRKARNFNAAAWEDRTGGVAARANLHKETDIEREERVRKYLKDKHGMEGVV